MREKIKVDEHNEIISKLKGDHVAIREIVENMKANRRIQAIKMVRQYTRAGLREAKLFMDQYSKFDRQGMFVSCGNIEQLERDVRGAIDPDYLLNVSQIKSDDLKKLRTMINKELKRRGKKNM